MQLCFRVTQLLFTVLLTMILPSVLAAAEPDNGLVVPARLRCEYLHEPQGIDVRQPRLSWWLESKARAQRQTAYQVLVATTLELLAVDQGDSWDSGKVDSQNSSQILYQGRPLVSGQTLYWKVRTWDAQGIPGAYSASASFSTGLLEPTDWQAQWISSEENGSPLLRKQFAVDRKVRSAKLYIAGIGYYEAFLNGSKVGDHVLDPASSYYTNDQPWPLTDRVWYVTYDVTDMIRPGNNVIGAMLGHGWYSADGGSPGRQPYGDRPRLLAQLVVDNIDGGRTIVGSDATWQTMRGPVIANEICLGESYDARLEQSEWSTSAAETSQWKSAIAVAAPSQNLSAQMLPPCRVISTLPAVKMSQTAPGVYLFDFGQHFSGWTQLRVKGPRGTMVRIRHAGAIFDDGRLDTRSNHSATQTDHYTLRGGEEEIWEPRFTLHGFRYAELTGFPGTPTLETLTGRHVRNDVDVSGTFTCSHPLLNQIQSNIQWTLATSLQGIPQDAAERNERMGWLGDTGFVAEEYFVNFDAASFWTKWLREIRDSQRPNGDVPVISPLHFGRVPGMSETKAWRGAPDWTSTYPLLVWYMYWYHGDRRIVEEHYEPLQRLVAWYESQAKDGILASVLGDHMEPQDDGTSSYAPLHTPANLTTTCYYFRVATILHEMALVLEKPADAERYSLLARQIQSAFHRRFFNAEKKIYGTGSQASLAVPLEMGIVPPEHQTAVLQSLVSELERRQFHLSTGIIGTRGVMEALRQQGRADVLYNIATQTTYPSWGFQIGRGATTIWESFGEAGPKSANTLSLNMKMFCNASKFFHQQLAGLTPKRPGFERVQIRPCPVGALTSASSTQDTVQGRFEVSWELRPKTFCLQVTVPVGAIADLSLPVFSIHGDSVRESGQLIWESGELKPNATGIISARRENSTIDFTIASGKYVFESANNSKAASPQ